MLFAIKAYKTKCQRPIDRSHKNDQLMKFEVNGTDKK
jgi:hypothetical protein